MKNKRTGRMQVCKEYDRLLDIYGIRASDSGDASIVLRREDALRAVAFLREAHVPILGGDVYSQSENQIKKTYDNWHTDPKQNEDKGTYVHRTLEEAQDYIRRFSTQQNFEPLFALVVGEVI